MGSQWVRQMDAAWPTLGRDTGRLRVALLGRTSADVRDVMLEGPSGLLNIYPPSLRDRVHWYPSRRRLDLPNGAMCTVFSSEEPAQLRGPQVHISWADEIATYKQLRSAEDDATAWENLRIATRLGSLPQVLATTTPKRVPLLRTLLAEQQKTPDTILIRRGRTRDNRYLSRRLSRRPGRPVRRDGAGPPGARRRDARRRRRCDHVRGNHRPLPGDQAPGEHAVDQGGVGRPDSGGAAA